MKLNGSNSTPRLRVVAIRYTVVVPEPDGRRFWPLALRRKRAYAK